MSKFDSFRTGWQLLFAAVALALLLVTLVVANMRWPVIDVTFAKGQRLANESRTTQAPDAPQLFSKSGKR